jgi:hypothetical protein
MSRALLAAGCALVAASCVPCTLIGCESAVIVKLATAELQTLGEGPSQLRLCIEASCTEGTIDVSTGSFTAAFSLDGALLRASRSDASTVDQATVSLTISRSGTERFSRTWQNVKFAGQFPNGPGCGEVCRVASVDATTP